MSSFNRTLDRVRNGQSIEISVRSYFSSIIHPSRSSNANNNVNNNNNSKESNEQEGDHNNTNNHSSTCRRSMLAPGALNQLPSILSMSRFKSEREQTLTGSRSVGSSRSTIHKPPAAVSGATLNITKLCLVWNG